jgi:hypothetical protein
VFDLEPETQAELDEYCKGLSPSEAKQLRDAIKRVCADPSGRREPRHRFTRPFRNPKPYVGKVPKGMKLWEFKTNHHRGLFWTGQKKHGGKTVRRLAFVRVKGARFFRTGDAPWPH